MIEANTFWVIAVGIPGRPGKVTFLSTSVPHSSREDAYAPVVFDSRPRVDRFMDTYGGGQVLGPISLERILELAQSGASGISLNPSVPPMASEVVSFEGFEALYSGRFTIKHKAFFKEVRDFQKNLLKFRQDPENLHTMVFLGGNEYAQRDHELATQGMVYLTRPDGSTSYKHISKLTLLDVPAIMREIEMNAAHFEEHSETDETMTMFKPPNSERVVITPSIQESIDAMRRLMKRWTKLRDDWPDL